MVDFAKLLKDQYEKASPEEKARMDAWRETEKRYDATKETIDAEFASYIMDIKKGEKPKLTTVRTWNSKVEVRLEGDNLDLIKFIGAVTGHECFRLDEHFMQWVQSENNDDQFYICAGSARYNSCKISRNDVVAYLQRHRPDLFQAPSLSMA